MQILSSTINNLENYQDKIAVVTGGKQGLGKYIANELLSKGITVVVTSRSFPFTNSSQLQNDELNKQYLDVTRENSVREFFKWINALPKKLFVLINNAGIGKFTPLIDTTLDDWQSIIQTNLTGTFLCSREAIKIMQENGGGRIINIGSVADKIPLANNAAYGVSKSGLKQLAAIINEECKFEKIRVTHVSLGAVYTDIWKNRKGFAKEDMLDCETVAQCIVFLSLLPLMIRLDNIEIFPEKGVL